MLYCIKHKSYRISFIITLLCILLLVLVVMIMSAVPPVSRDALTHHLAVPKLWIKHGGIVGISHLPLSYYPMNLNLLYTLPMLCENDILPKYIHFLFALGTAWLLFLYLKLRTTSLLALIGVLLFLSTPVIVRLSVSAYVDLGLVFFSWAAIFYFLKWLNEPQKIKNLVFSAIFCGLGMGTKYNGLIPLILLTLFIPAGYLRKMGKEQCQIKKVVGYPMLFFIVATAVCSPWLIRNLNATGNPVYPLYNRQIGGERGLSEISNQSMKPWLQRRLIYKETVLETALIPVRIFFKGQDDNPRLFDGKLNPMLFLLPLLLLLGRNNTDERIKLETLILLAYSCLYILYASFLVDMRIRYIAPSIPPLVVLATFGLEKMMQWFNNYPKDGMKKAGPWLTVTVLIGFLSINANYIMKLFVSVDPIPYATGQVSRQAYVSEKLPEYEAVTFINEQQDDNINLLALFVGKRLYYFEKPVVFGTQQFAGMVKNTSDHRELSVALNDAGFTHCMVGVSHFRAWVRQTFTEHQKAIIAQWLANDCGLLFRKNGYVVLNLLPQGHKRELPR